MIAETVKKVQIQLADSLNLSAAVITIVDGMTDQEKEDFLTENAGDDVCKIKSVEKKIKRSKLVGSPFRVNLSDPVESILINRINRIRQQKV